MGERKGQNLYYPPDFDPRKHGSLNAYHGTHALRERANKLHLGILVIRFEMPYNIWCEGCGNHIGMGVRYNAEKKKVGMYYTTPVYQFRMKCHLCDNYFEIKTDPANLDYEILSGARRQERRWDPTQNGQVVPETKETSRKLFDDAMFKLEHGDKDQGKARDEKPQLRKLCQIQDRVKDDYLANRILRDEMRARRKAGKAQKAADDALLARASLSGSGLKLLPEAKDDARAAALLKLQAVHTSEEKQAVHREAILDANIFAQSPTKQQASPRGQKEALKQSLEGLVTKHRHREIAKRAAATTPLTKSGLGVVIKKRKSAPEATATSPAATTAVDVKAEVEEVELEAVTEGEEKQGCSSASTSSCQQAKKSLLSLCDYNSSSGED